MREDDTGYRVTVMLLVIKIPELTMAKTTLSGFRNTSFLIQFLLIIFFI